jgi:VWFA-related protein
MMRSCVFSLVALVAGCYGASVQTALDQVTIPQLKVDSDTVQAFVSVVDERGAPVKGLGPANFKVALDNTPVRAITVHHVQEADRGISVVLAIDISGSMRGRKIEAVLQGADRFLSTLGERDYCALMTFGNNVAWLVEEFTNDKRALRSKLENIQATDAKTVLNEAFFRAVQKGEKAPTAQVAVVVLTDGVDEGSSISLDQAAREAQPRSVPVYTLGFGNLIDSRALAQVATLTGGRFLPAAADADLVDLYLTLLKQSASQYVLETPTGTIPAGSHTLAVEVQSRGLHITQTRGFQLNKRIVIAPTHTWIWVAAGILGLTAGGAALWLLLKRKRRQEPAKGSKEVRKCLYCHADLTEDETDYCSKCSGEAPPEHIEPPSPPEECLVWIEALVGSQKGKPVPIAVDIFTVGRGSDRSLVLDGARSISRDHAEIRRRGDSYVLKNTQGQGGTYINGSKMGIDEPLKNGDQIGLGGPDPKVVFHDKRVRRAAV